MVEDVVVPGAGDAQEALRFRSCREQTLAELIGHDLVTIAVGGEEGHLESVRQRKAVEAVAGKRRERAIVTPGDISATASSQPARCKTPSAISRAAPRTEVRSSR